MCPLWYSLPVPEHCEPGACVRPLGLRNGGGVEEEVGMNLYWEGEWWEDGWQVGEE